MVRKMKLDWGKSPPKPHYRYIKGKVSRYDGPVFGKTTMYNCGPFGLIFVGTPPPLFVIQEMFNSLRDNGRINPSIFSKTFQEKEKSKFWSKLWKAWINFSWRFCI